MLQQKAFITGASSGIGLETVKYLVTKGWQVAATMRNPDAAAELKDLPGVRVYALDVTQPDNVKSVVQTVWQDFGGIDVVINNAGYGAIGPFESATEAQIQLQMDTNFMGTVRVMKAFIPLLKQQKKGVLINLSSVAGRVGMPLYNIYHASKFAVEGLTESLYYELRPFGIRVRLVEPGPIKTEFNGRSREDLVAPEGLGYTRFVGQINRFYNKMFSEAEGADVVAKTIYKAAIRKGSKIRYPSGRIAKSLMVLNKLTPGSWMRVISRKIMGI
ncbi:SDR family oxidoreductase [Geofilum rubicundum]|uniref:Dehydrogenase n=1 Tax=Geofilum rubicundum JCM 15548 TaxID=1236989 RepID=A0A0E9M1V7_9BACT|nr:SDR family oxidoreductase [Geofilum rubicundum]GAO31563.1 dehydrogenase [Geofilum rubicundum JCM 15548]